jgi:RNA ligase (TIGR02306 family)
MERQLASIQKIDKLEPIPGADKIEVATVLGWHLVVKKGEFQIGDRCVYMEVDSILPDRPEFEFLRPRHMRIKTIKLRGQVSQGIAFPLSILPVGTILDGDLGDNVTEQLGIKKYEPYIPAELSGQAKGNFPEFLHKTDEIRVQSVPGVLFRHQTKPFYVTEKVDGSSMTVYLRYTPMVEGFEFGVCSRNWDLKEDAEYTERKNAFWKLARELDLEGKLKLLWRASGHGFALQGELLGMGVQKNKYNFHGIDFYVYNIFDIDEQRYLDFHEIELICQTLGLTMVPVVSRSYTLPNTIDEVVEYSKGNSVLNKDVPREGVVFRPLKEERDEELGRLSFKCINPDFLLKFDE